MERLIKGKTIDGKWFVRPYLWAGIWSKNGELDSSQCNTLIETPDETIADQYMDVYRLVNLVDEEVNKMPEVKDTLFVYDMDDYEIWVSDVSEEDTAKAYCEEYGLQIGKDIEVDDITECDQEKEGMYWNFDNNEEITNLIKNLLEDKSTAIKKYEFGNLKCKVANCEGPAIFIPYKKAIRLHGEYVKPYMIACSEC